MTLPAFADRAPPRPAASPHRLAILRARRLAAAFVADRRGGPVEEFALTGLAEVTDSAGRGQADHLHTRKVLTNQSGPEGPIRLRHEEASLEQVTEWLT